MTFQNEVHLKNLEDSLSSAIKTKNELIFEIQEKDQRIIELQHDLNKLNHDLTEKDYHCRELEERLNSKKKPVGKNEFKLHKEYLKNELEKGDMNVKLANLNHDISCLLSAFHQAKKTGNFDLKNLNLKEISVEKIFEDEPKRVHFADTGANSTEYFKAELRHKEDLIDSLQQELKNLKNQYEGLINGVS
ncbi:myosin-9-like isoform X2 [Brachionus plicatilis]|uniref:Myosin-9-like isoform X2 n=1 Tax=Brachionus plicatilis TaxID=10195 RepID=A0A3M7S8S7_BRAPC|nr:myosin-9-like isoform X2 [Brachionus plicatilis]